MIITKKIKTEFKKRYGIVFDDLKTIPNYSDAAFHICNGNYESIKNIKNHMDILLYHLKESKIES